MKIRRETDYAIRAIRALINSGGKPLLSKEVADRESIPQSYILTIMCKLKGAGIVTTVNKHGNVQGGYKLLVDPDKACIYDIVRLFEGDMKINACLRDEDDCPNKATCTVHVEMQRINDALIAEMKRKSITEILQSN
jgi:Rrf2 family protein